MSSRHIQKAAVDCLLSVEQGTNLRQALLCGKHLENSEQAAFVAGKLQEQIIIGERPAVGSAVLRRF